MTPKAGSPAGFPLERWGGRTGGTYGILGGSAPGVDQAAYADRIGPKARIRDPHGVLSGRKRGAAGGGSKQRRQLRPLEKKAFASLNLAHDAEKDQIKARFKELVKLHHPDANGGDRRSEEKLREIIQAYNYLKQVGLV